MKRKIFNDGWTFKVGSGNALDALINAEAADEQVIIDLPHDSVIHTKRFDSPKGNGEGFYAGQNIFYKKKFDLLEKDSQKVVWFEFEGIYQNAFIYINNEFAGRCIYGYGNYYIDATKFVDFGKTNEITVVVKNGVLSGRWYTGGGIYRDVRIMIGNHLHIKCEGTKISANDIEKDQAVICTATPIEYIGCRTTECFVLNEIFDANGILVASDKAPITMYDHETKELRQKMVVTNPELWDINRPYLYSCCTKIIVNDEVIDEDTNTFGIRKLQLDVNHGLRINGKTVNLRGGCIHHDNGIIGAASFEKADERRIRKLKDAGYNAIRTAPYPIGKTMLDVCDKIGMLVFDEFSDIWSKSKVDFDYGVHFDLNWEQDIANMVHKDYNHPSVIMYSVGNEIGEASMKVDKSWGKKLADKVRSIDSTRYVTMSLNLMLCAMPYMGQISEDIGGMDKRSPEEINTMMASMGMEGPMVNHPLVAHVTEEACAQVDLIGYNYSNSRYEKDHQLFPNRIMFGSETFPRELANNWKRVEELPYVIGDFCWAAWDYLGEAGIGRLTYEKTDGFGSFYGPWPWRTAYVGTIDLIGDRRPISYWREIVWGLRAKPYISVQDPKHFGKTPNYNPWSWMSDNESSWNWPGFENKPVAIEVYSCADEIELFVNGASIGKKQVGQDIQNCVVFDTIYSPGEIKAVASNGEEFILKTATDDSHINLSLDTDKMEKGGRDIAYIEISICDADGITNPASEKSIHVEVDGEGILLGLGSANPSSIEDYYANDFAVYGGRALAIIRSGNESGEAQVTVSAEGCESQTLIISIV